MRNTTRISGKRAAKAQFDAAAYAGLLTEALPKIITTVAQNKRMLKIFDKLMDKGENRTPEEGELMKLLGHLIHTFEQEHYKMEKLTPRQALIEMMKMNHLKQADIVHIFGSRGVTSEVINGKRGISKASAKKLAAFFNTSADLFL